MKCVVYVFILALSACLIVVWWSACPDNAEKGVEQNCDATMTVDGKFTSKSRTESASAASRVVSRPPQTVKAAENVQPVLAQIAADCREPEPLRLAAANSARLLAE